MAEGWMSYLYALPVVVVIIVVVIAAIIFGFTIAQSILNTQSSTSIAYTTGSNVLTQTGQYFGTYVPLIVLALLGGFALAVLVVILFVAIRAAQNTRGHGR